MQHAPWCGRGCGSAVAHVQGVLHVGAVLEGQKYLSSIWTYLLFFASKVTRVLKLRR